MNIYIPSRGRSSRKFLTAAYSVYRWLNPREPSLLPLRKRAFYCVRSDEYDAYEKALAGTDIKVLDVGMTPDLGSKRDVIARHAKACGEKKFMMCDDDVMLYVRKSPDVFNLRYPQPKEILALFEEIEDLLDDYCMVGVSAREGNNRIGVGEFPLIRENTRAMRMYAFRTADYLSIKPNRLKEMADFDTTLQFLRSGRKNAVIHYWAQGQAASQTDGGCSAYRTAASHEKVVRQLAELHPQFIRIRTVKRKISATKNTAMKDFAERHEVTVSWQKAYKSSLIGQKELDV